jgi:hypothetical protein
MGLRFSGGVIADVLAHLVCHPLCVYRRRREGKKREDDGERG